MDAPDPNLPLEPPDPERPASATPTEYFLQREMPGGEAVAAHDPYAALRFPQYRAYAAGNLAYNIGQQMLGAVVQYQVYALTQSTTALGLVGLIQALPIIVLALPAGHAADRHSRRGIVLASLAAMAVCSLALAAVSYDGFPLPDTAPLRHANAALAATARFMGERDVRFDTPGIPILFLILLITGVARAYNDPARSSLLPTIVPAGVFGNAVTWNSSMFQIAAVSGPAMAGLLLGLLDPKVGWLGTPLHFSIIYSLDALCTLTMFGFVLPLRPPPVVRKPKSASLEELQAGVKFVFQSKIILATITLDLFAVLLGGAVMLLPVFAELLHVGAIGFGFLKAMPAIGAFIMAMTIAHRAPMKKAGQAMLWAVAGFGGATIVFGLSPLVPGAMTRVLGLPIGYWVALVSLGLTGAFDNVSVVVRHTLVQLLTPDEMRGRVSAVNNVFIGSSNELGALESGLTTSWLKGLTNPVMGPILSVVGGGVGTILVVVAVFFAWPQVRKYGSLGSRGAGHG